MNILFTLNKHSQHINQSLLEAARLSSGYDELHRVLLQKSFIVFHLKKFEVNWSEWRGVSELCEVRQKNSERNERNFSKKQQNFQNQQPKKLSVYNAKYEIFKSAQSCL